MLDRALRLHRLGFSLIPLKPGSKEPEGRWTPYQTEPPTEQEVRAWFGNGVRRNAGIVLGSVSGVVVVESDTAEAETWCASNLPRTPMMTRSARGIHRYYLRPAVEALPAFIDAGAFKIELKRDGQYVVAPGSLHPTGVEYAEVEPWPESLDALPVLPPRFFASSAFLSAPAEPLPQHVDHGVRNTVLFREACRLRRLGWQEPEILGALQVLNVERCQPPLEQAELASIASGAARYAPAADTFPLTDTGNAEFFASVSTDFVRYDHSRRQWACFGGHHWEFDRTEHVDRLALEAIRGRQSAALLVTDTEQRKRLAKWAMDSENRPRRDNLVRLAAKLAAIAFDGDGWDSDPWLLGVQNGVLDLRTGRLLPGRPGHNITKVAPVSFDPAAPCPRFERFVREIFADHVELADYLQRWLGYALTGVTTEQVFWILWGEGSNGKSTLMEVVMRAVLGDAYAWTMPFPAAGWSNAMSEYQKAGLVGQRLVAASEVAHRGQLNEELIKSLTGDDTVNARHPYGRPFAFVPVAKFVLRVNDKPVIRDQSHGMWRRVKLIPFTQTFGPDRNLSATLTSEAPGILAWAVRGCLDWQRDGLRHPEVVEAATREYQAESDPLVSFFAECCVLAPAVSVGGQELFRRYQSWCEGQQLPEFDRLSQKAFGTRIRQKFVARDGRTVTYLGIGLRTDRDAPEGRYSGAGDM